MSSRHSNLRRAAILILFSLLAISYSISGQRGGGGGGGGAAAGGGQRGGTTGGARGGPTGIPGGQRGTFPPNIPQRGTTTTNGQTVPAGQRAAIRPPADIDLVTAYVTVTAAKNATPPRLTEKDFHISEDNKEQKIEFFAVHDQPFSVGIVYGGGMDSEIQTCPKAFVTNSPPGTEYFVLAGDTVTIPFSTDPNALPEVFGGGSSSSPDSVYIGLDVLKEAANARKILLVITGSNGGGGGQLTTEYVENAAIKESTQIHVATFVNDAANVNLEGANFLGEIAELTGGSYNTVPPTDIFCANLAKELRVQYVVGFHPTNSAKDGKWRKLSIKVDSPEEGPKLKARIKRGYKAQKVSS